MKNAFYQIKQKLEYYEPVVLCDTEAYDNHQGSLNVAINLEICSYSGFKKYLKSIKKQFKDICKINILREVWPEYSYDLKIVFIYLTVDPIKTGVV